MEKIDWKALGFDFSGDSPLKKVIDAMNEIISTSNKMAEILVANNKKINSELEQFRTEAGQMVDSVKKINIENSSSGKALSDAAKKTNDLSASMSTLNSIQRDNITTLEKLKTQTDQVNKAKEEATKKNLDEAGSLNDLKKKLVDAEAAYRKMGEAEPDRKKQLDAIKELSVAYNTQDKALQEAKKGVESVSGSYYALQQRVTMLKKELKDFSGGLDNNNIKTRALQKEIKEGTDKLKAFDSAIGDNFREVGHYEKATEELTGWLRLLKIEQVELVEKSKSLGAAFTKLSTNPWILALTALIGIVAAVNRGLRVFYETTGEGEKIAKRQEAAWEAFGIIYEDVWRRIGKNTSDALGDQEQKVSAFQRLVVGGLRVLDKITPGNVYKAIADDIDKLSETLVEAVQEQIELNKKIREANINRAKEEVNIAELTLDSADKINFTDKQRLAMTQEITKKRHELAVTEIENLREQLALDEEDFLLKKNISKEEIKNLSDERKAALLTGAEKTHLAELQIKIFNRQADQFNEDRRNNMRSVQLQLDSEKTKIDSARREFDSFTEFNKRLIENEISTNSRIIKNDKATQEEKLVAINSNLKDKLAILKIEEEQETVAAERAAHDRLVGQVKDIDKEIQNDLALFDQKNIILLKYKDLAIQVNKDTLDAVKENIFTGLKKDFDELSSGIKEESIAKLMGVNKAFSDREIEKEKDFQHQKTKIQIDSEIERLQNEILYNKAILDSGLTTNQERLDAETKINEDILRLSDLEVQKRLENDRKIAESRQKLERSLDLVNQAVMAGFEIQSNARSYEAQQIEIETRDIQKQYDKAIESAGDNADAKIAVDKKYNRLLEEEQKKNLKVRQKQAVADKIAAAFSIAINTAKAIVEVLPDIPLSIAIGAIGAAEEIAVLTKPIPQFEKGTESSPEGPAILAENRKRELTVDKSGQATLYDTENAGGMLTYLKQGTRVYSNDETEKILGTDEFVQMGSALRGAKKVITKSGRSVRQQIILDQKPVLDELRKFHRPPNYVRIASDLYEVKKVSDDASTRIRKMSI